MTTVFRQPANRQGDTIVSSVLTDESSRIELGRQYINREQFDKLLENLRCFETSFKKPKDIASINANGESTKGYIKTFVLSLSGSSVYSSVIVEVQK